MRIRSIKPEFWSSEDVAALDWPTRLLFIGLWSYVDDNGVGRDVEKLIVADLFPLEDDPREALATVSRGLARLAEDRLITRYAVDSKPYLHVTTWSAHQKIDRPGKSRYPLPTCENAVLREGVARVSRGALDMSAPGAVEQGSRGAGEEVLTPDDPQQALLVEGLAAAPRVSAPPDAPPTPTPFDEFWAAYPRKEGKIAARRAYDRAVKAASHERVMAGLTQWLPQARNTEARFIPHPERWLNAGRWDDEAPAARPRAINRDPWRERA